MFIIFKYLKFLCDRVRAQSRQRDADWSVLAPPRATEPAAQPTGWQRATVAIAMEARLSQTSVRPAVIGDLLPQPQLPILGCVSGRRPLPAARAPGGQGAGGGAALLGLHSQKGGQVQVQTCRSSSGPRRVLSTLRTWDPHLEDRGVCLMSASVSRTTCR